MKKKQKEIVKAIRFDVVGTYKGELTVWHAYSRMDAEVFIAHVQSLTPDAKFEIQEIQ